MKTRYIIQYIALALIWGFSYLIIAKVAHAFGWAGAVAFRSFIAAAILLAVARLLRRRLDFSRGWLRFAIVGATTVAVQLVLLSYAAPLVGTAMSAIFCATIPLFTLVIGRVWGIERITPQGLVGLLLGFAGIVLLVGFPAVPFTLPFFVGCASCLVAALSAAFGGNYLSRRLRETGSLEVTIGSFLSAGVLTLPFLLAVPVPRMPGLEDFLYLAISGAVMSALAFFVYFRLIVNIGATRAASVDFAATAVAVVVGACLLGEQLTLPQIAGAAVIICGCVLVLDLVPVSARRLRLESREALDPSNALERQPSPRPQGGD